MSMASTLLPQTVTVGQQVHVVRISHKHGEDAWVCATAEGATDSVYDYVCQWWDDALSKDETLPETPPEEQEKALTLYFAAFADDNYPEDYAIVQQRKPVRGNMRRLSCPARRRVSTMLPTYHFSHTSEPCEGRLLASDESLIARYFREMHARARQSGRCQHCWLPMVVPGYRFCPACCHTTYAEMPPAYYREFAISERC